MRKFLTFLVYATLIELAQMTSITMWIFRKQVAIYGTNDDALISSISSGQLTGAPDPHLIFIQPIISYPIVFLENITKTYSGYSIFLLFCATMSFSLILVNMVIERKINVPLSIAWLISNVVFLSWYALNPTYTGSSIFTAGSAAALLIYLLKNNQSKNKAALIASISLLFTLSYGIRIEGIYIFLVFALPFVLLNITQLSKLKKDISIIILLVGISFILNLILSANLYSNNEWSEYIKTNSIRHKIQLREPERQMQSHLEEINWDTSTFEMFKRFILLDSKEMNSENMQIIINSTDEYVGVKSILKTNPQSTIKSIINSNKSWTWIIQILSFIIFLNFLLRIGNINLFRLYFINVSILLLSILTLLYVLSGGFHLPERISINTLGAFSMILITLSSEKLYLAKKKRKIFIPIVLTLSALILIKLTSRYQIELEARENFYKTRQVYAIQQQETLNAMNDKIIISGASSLKSDWRFPYFKYTSFDPRNRILILGWHNLSPIWSKSVKSLGLDPNNVNLAISSGLVAWVDSEENISTLITYFNSIHKHSTQFTRLGDIGNGEYGLYKFQSIIK